MKKIMSFQINIDFFSIKFPLFCSQMLSKSLKVFGFPRPTNLFSGKHKGKNYDPLVIQEHDIFSSMKTTNDFSFKGALQITDNLLILFVKLDFIIIIIIIIIVFIQSKDKNTYPKLQ